MNTLRRVVLFVIDMVFALLTLNALAIVFGVLANLLIGGGHSHWAASTVMIGMAIALRTFIWLLPLTVLMFLIGSLVSQPTTIGKNGKK
jgi:hypothetical protein